MSDRHDQFYKAGVSRDPRFDGKFFTAVKTTGIYCRPICPAKPKRQNVEYFLSAALAEKAGYRPCLRCRPEAAPQSALWYGKSAVVGRAVRMILEQGIPAESEETFAGHFGVTARHLRRLFHDELGKTPQQFYQEQRLNLARKLLVETKLPVTEIAFASGFQSLRRFNDAFKERFKKAPSLFRKTKVSSQADRAATFYLSYRPPFRFDAVLTYLKRHEVFGVEEISNDQYDRYFETKNGMGKMTVKNAPDRSALEVTFHQFDLEHLYSFLPKVRRLFDLDSDPLIISQSFKKSALLKKLNQKNPGGRSPGAWSSFETSMMIILAQLVSNTQARALLKQLVEQYGKQKDYEGKTVFVFPTPTDLSTADFSKIGTTLKRKETIRAFCDALLSGELDLNRYDDPEKQKKLLLSLPGIGPWTAEAIGMRCLGDPDSYPASDLILKRIQANEPELNLDEVKPWRSYAVYLLWEHHAAQAPLKPISKKEKKK